MIGFLITIAIFALFAYYVWVMIMFITDEYKTKKQLKDDLIPFKFWFKVAKEKYNALENEEDK